MEGRLKKYNEIEADISRLEWKIRKMENEEAQASTAVLEVTGIKPKGYTASSVENKAIKNVDNIAKYKQKILELTAEKKMIDSLINTLKGKERQVIELRYKHQLKWESIAVSIDRDTSRAKAIKDSAIKKMNKIYERQD